MTIDNSHKYMYRTSSRRRQQS